MVVVRRGKDGKYNKSNAVRRVTTVPVIPYRRPTPELCYVPYAMEELRKTSGHSIRSGCLIFVGVLFISVIVGSVLAEA